MSFWSDLVGTIEQVIIGNPAGVSAPGGPGVGLATSAAGVTAIEGIWSSVTDGKLWRSLGWLLLGVLLMILGALALARQSAQSVAAGLAKGVV